MSDTRKYKTRSKVDVQWVPGLNIEGKIVEFGTLPESAESRRFMVVDTAETLYRIYESKDLEEAFKLAEIGDSISVTFIGKKSIKGNKSFSSFNTRLWS